MKDKMSKNTERKKNKYGELFEMSNHFSLFIVEAEEFILYANFQELNQFENR